MVNREQVRHRLLTNIVRNDAPGAFPTSVFYSLVAYLFGFSKNDRVSSSIGSAVAFRRSSLPFVRHTRARTRLSSVYFDENGLTTVVFHFTRIPDSFVVLLFFPLDRVALPSMRNAK